MSRFLVLQHVAAEPFGLLDPLLRARGHRVRYVNFGRDPLAQPRLERYHGLIVLGGPMNVVDCGRHSHLITEMRLIEQALAQDKPVLGICLGAQLLAHVLGAPVRRLQRPEIGWYRLDTTPAGRIDPILQPLGAGVPVFQWHSCSFELPSGAQHLASTTDCANQAFRHGRNAYGFQFHLEADEALIGRWLANPPMRAELERAGLEHGVPELYK